jgi:hypothetical protein
MNPKRGLKDILGTNMPNTPKRRRDLNVRATLPSVNLRSAGFALQRDSWRANAFPLLDEQDAAEKIGLQVEP